MKYKILGIFLIPFLFLGCVSIPPEAPELSMELGKRISSIEEANIKLLNKFFDQKRAEVDSFIEDEWVPTFAKNVFSDRKISTVWDKIVASGNKQDRLKFLIMTGPALQNKINQKRLELIQPLDTLERKIAKAIRQEYTQARAINNSITGLLTSASEVVENRNSYLDMIGVTENKISTAIDKTDDIVSSLLDKSKDAPQKVDKAIAYIKKLKSLKDSI